MADTVAASFGNAVFELATEEGWLIHLKEDLIFSIDLLREEKDLKEFLYSDHISKDEKKKFIQKLLSNRISEPYLSFLLFVIDRGQVNELIPILEQIDRHIKQQINQKEAVVITAIPLSDLQKQAIEKELLSVTKAASLVIDWKVDEKILGGLIVQLEEIVFDSSVRTKLEQMEKKILSL